MVGFSSVEGDVALALLRLHGHVGVAPQWASVLRGGGAVGRQQWLVMARVLEEVSNLSAHAADMCQRAAAKAAGVSDE